MIIKEMDSKQEEIKELSSLLKENITSKQRLLIERELKAMRKGVHGEEDSAYYINFYYGNSKNLFVIHDLRLEHEGQVAQIDHLLINRVFDIYVLESKNYSYGIKITPEGEFLLYNGKRYFGIPSPIEQNKRHIHLLKLFLKSNEILSKRINPKIKSFILLSPKSVILRPSGKKFDTSMVIKADSLKTKLDEDADNIGLLDVFTYLPNMSSSATTEEAARKLASFHKPIGTDFRAKFGLSSETYQKPHESPAYVKEDKKSFSHSKYYCAKCKKPISEKVAKFCWQNMSKFGGKPYCYECQKGF